VSWYLRSMADHDTHRGNYSVVTRSVHALCGIEFVAKELPLGGPALPGSPLDPTRCVRSAGAAGEARGTSAPLPGRRSRCSRGVCIREVRYWDPPSGRR
jgi:hypothetical protein